MAPYLLKMRENLASALKTDVENINIKATTEEKLGFTGRKEGISAHAVCIILKN
jgi:2-C-methyl-D-erythritol 2,4-cyclodiphosphate synthase